MKLLTESKVKMSTIPTVLITIILSFNLSSVYGQTIELSDADFVVTNVDDFLDALNIVKSNQVIYIKDDAEVDLSKNRSLHIPSGVTIASGRGINNSKGGVIFTDVPASPLITCGSDVTFIGLRVKGPDMEKYHKGKIFKGKNATQLNMYKNPVSKGIVTENSNLKVLNCELFGWTHSAIVIKNGASNSMVMNNYIHHNMRFGLGYGVTVDGGFAYIKNNTFDYNRHDIAGTGKAGSGYEVSNNVFLENTYSHSVDMHGGKDRKDNTNIAGSLMKVYNNTFKRFEKARAILIRGVPIEGGYFYNNTIEILTNGKTSGASKSMKDYIQQINAKGNLEIYGNTIK